MTPREDPEKKPKDPSRQIPTGPTNPETEPGGSPAGTPVNPETEP